MKVLWISLRLFDDTDEKQTAVWLKALANKLSSYPNLTLGNISIGKGISNITRCDYGNINQWALPSFDINKKGLPELFICKAYEKILEEFKPDIIQVWGSENPLKILPFENKYPAAKVLTMQGVMGSIADKSLIGISFGDLIKTFGIRELIKRENIYDTARSFDKEAKLENIMVQKSGFIITQSNWTDSQIKHINPKARYFRVQRELRPEFLEATKKWTDFNHKNPIIYSAAIGYTLKGLHILIKALSIVKLYYPNVELRLAGAIGRTDWLGDGYLRLILKYIESNNLQNNVIWLGAISSKQIISNLQEASVFVNPSFVESYSMVVAEAMSIGTPSVVSFAGAMPELAEDKKEALYFSPGDYKQLAYNILTILNNKSLSREISLASQIRSNLRINKIDNALEQYKIYEEIIQMTKSTS